MVTGLQLRRFLSKMTKEQLQKEFSVVQVSKFMGGSVNIDDDAEIEIFPILRIDISDSPNCDCQGIIEAGLPVLVIGDPIEEEDEE